MGASRKPRGKLIGWNDSVAVLIYHGLHDQSVDSLLSHGARVYGQASLSTGFRVFVQVLTVRPSRTTRERLEDNSPSEYSRSERWRRRQSPDEQRERC